MVVGDGGRGRWRAGAMLVLVGALALGGCQSCEDTREREGNEYFEPFEPGDYEVSREPRLQVPEVVDFGLLEGGEQRTRIIEVANRGRSTLELYRWSLSAPSFTMEFPGFTGDAAPARLEPGQSVEVALTYTASGALPTRGELVLETNDPKREEARIELRANLSTPCLEVSPSEPLDFGPVSPERPEVGVFTLKNCSQTAETIFSYQPRLDAQATGFRILDFERYREVVMAPGSAIEIEVEFSPWEPGDYRDTFVLETNVEERPEVELEVLGRGAEYRCPRAILEASLEGREAVTADPEGTFTGLPLDTVRLSGRASQSPESFGIERLEWSLISKPADSGATLRRLRSSQERELYMDLSGDYVVELEVWDSVGTRSCEPARMTLRAVPDEDIHVQLVWDTPQDNNQFDTLGTDVDLHLLRTGGVWNSKPWDCFWQNLEPDWGRQNDSSDDPSLDIDDVDGWGPENINLNNPEAGMRYHVGVHYFSDQGYGSSYATVRLYLGGVLVDEQRRRRMRDQEFWRVLDVDWPSREVVIVNDLDETFPEGTFGRD